MRRTAHGAGISGSVGGVRPVALGDSGSGSRGRGESARAAGAGAAGASRGGRGATAARVRAPQPIDRARARAPTVPPYHPSTRPDSQTVPFTKPDPRRNPLPTLNKTFDSNTKALNFLQNGLTDFIQVFPVTLVSQQKGITPKRRVFARPY